MRLIGRLLGVVAGIRPNAGLSSATTWDALDAGLSRCWPTVWLPCRGGSRDTARAEDICRAITEPLERFGTKIATRVGWTGLVNRIS